MRPKPMIEIGGKPILWHIMKIYSAHGINDFVVCLGYKGYVIKEYFANYFLHTSDVTFDLARQRDGGAPDRRPSRGGSRWSTPASDTHDRRAAASGCSHYVGDEDVLLHLRRRRRRRRHRRAGRVPPRARPAGDGHGRAAAGPLRRARDRRRARSRGFQEKPHGDGGWINGGFFVLSARRRRLHRRRRHGLGARADGAAWRATGSSRRITHDGFWQPMDTLRDKRQLEDAVGSGRRAVEDVDVDPRLLARAGACWSPATPASRAAGCALWLDVDWAPT